MRAISFLLCACSVALIGADVAPQIKSSRVREAASLYSKQVARAEEDCNDRILKARRSYRDALVQAQGLAVKSGDLDEANAIRDEIRGLDEQTGSGAGDFSIIEARWGVKGKWSDFTKIAQSHVAGDALPTLDGLADPAVGQQKTIVIKAVYGGRPLVLICDTGNPLQAFFLGKPPRGAEPR